MRRNSCNDETAANIRLQVRADNNRPPSAVAANSSRWTRPARRRVAERRQEVSTARRSEILHGQPTFVEEHHQLLQVVILAEAEPS
ncbi:MAG TPA: hypothetical protein VMU34_26515 [Mycobacterium sp.]|nr:hypothetical protein [Mycobacterium sp.]